jgi:hypothetical protein
MSHRILWNAEQYQKALGPEGYAFFEERAERMIARCPVCGGTASVTVPDDVRNEAFKRQGRVTSHTRVLPCNLCWTRTARLYDFVRLYYLTVPPAYRFARLSQLQPYEGAAAVVSMERQQKILDALRANPGKGYAFFGPAHCGKTVWSTALYAENLYRTCMDGGWRGGSPIWRISAKKMLQEHTDYATHRFDKDDEGFSVVDQPSVSADKIVKLTKQGKKFRLFLEEIDKIKETESRRNNLFEIVNALHEQEGVLVVNSNLTQAEFQAQFGEDFAWRIGKMCTVVNLFEDKSNI